MTKKAILIENDPELRRLYELNLELYLGMEVLILHNADDVADYLKHNHDVSLIVSEKQVGDENTILKVFYTVNSNKLDIPIFLLGDEIKLREKIEMFDRQNWKAVIKKAAKKLSITAEEMVNKEVPDFYPIAMRHFLHLGQTNVDLYDYGSEAEGDHPVFHLAYKAGTALSRQEIEDGLLSKKEQLYVTKNERLKFLNHYTENVIHNLTKSQDNLKNRVTATSNAFYASQELMSSVGMTPEAIEAAKSTITSMVKIAEESQGLSELLEILEKDRSSYLYKHAMLIAAVAHFIVEKMEWGTKEHKEKVCIAAFFHDIAIPSDKLAMIHSKEQLQAAGLAAHDVDKVNKHASKAAEMLKDFPKTPIGTEMIVLQHHCQTNGIGFPEGFNSNLTPLAIVFFVIEEYVNVLINTSKEAFSKKKTMDQFREKFNKGYYRKTLDALEAVGSV